MRQQHRQVLLDAARSIAMMISRDELRMPPMTQETLKIHRKHLTNLRELIQYDLREPNFNLETPDG